MRIHRGHVLKALRYGTLGFLGTQAAAVSAVVAVDEMRKQRSPQSGRFPHLPPLSANVGENAMRIYSFGRDLYADMLADIRAAKDIIYFECFIVKDDDTGMTFRNALIDAAHRGVQVYVILDTWGNFNQNPRFRHFPKIDNLHTLLFPFIRTGAFTGRARDKGRDHRKILVVDNTRGYVGGYNIGTLYAEQWRDTHVRIDGPAVWELANSFIDMWNNYRKRHHPLLETPGNPNWDATIRATVNAPAQNIYPIAALYLDAINRSKDHVWITMGYFIPDEPMLQALTNAARRGVDVRILIPQFSNHIYADWVGRPHYERLLRTGVRIFLYQQAMVHAKTMTADGRWSTVGTANIDRLSLRGNFEINIEVFNPDFAASMERIYDVDMHNSHELTIEEWEQRSHAARIAERVLRPLAPLL